MSSTADGNHDHVSLGLLLEDLERLRSDARDQQRLIAGVQVAIAVLARELLAMLTRIVEVAPVEDQLGTEPPHGGNLDRVRLLGYADRHLALFRTELRDQVDPAPDLEGADRLMVLMLD